MKNPIFTEKNPDTGIYRRTGLKCSLCLVLLIASQMLCAQVLTQLDEQIAGMLSSPDPATVSEGQHLQSLTSDVHPTLFINNNVFVLNGGNQPIKVEVDIASLADLYQPEPAFTTVEILIIRVEGPSDLQSVINLEALNGFNNLKYLYFLCSYDVCPEFNQSQACLEAKLTPMLQGTFDGVLMILYKVSIPS